MCWGQGWARTEGHVPEKAPAKRENLPQCVGGGPRYRSHCAQKNFSGCMGDSVSLFTPGKAPQPAAEGPSTKHKRNAFYPRSPRASQMRSEFVTVSILTTNGIKTTSWDCTSAARINVSPLLRKNKKTKQKLGQCSYLTCALDSFE